MVERESVSFLCPVCRGSGSLSGRIECGACGGDGHLVAGPSGLPAALRATLAAESLLRAALDVTRAAGATVQIYDASNRCLKLVAHQGFGREFLDFFQVVSGDDCACGATMAKRARVLVTDVSTHLIFKGQPSREILLRAGIRSVQATPIVSASGRLLGVLSTHRHQKRRHPGPELSAIDIVVRQFAPALEACAPGSR